MLTLKYLRTLTDDKLKERYEHNRKYQLKWFDIYEYNYKNGVRDKDVCYHLESFTKNVNKIERVLEERNIIY